MENGILEFKPYSEERKSRLNKLEGDRRPLVTQNIFPTLSNISSVPLL